MREAAQRTAPKVKALTGAGDMVLYPKVNSCDKHATPYTAKRVLDDDRTRRSIQATLLRRGVSMVSWEESEAGWARI